MLTSTGCQFLTGQDSRDEIQDLVPEQGEPAPQPWPYEGQGRETALLSASFSQEPASGSEWLK